jgi:hypothetical protein
MASDLLTAHCATGTAHFVEGMDDSDSFHADICIQQRVTGIIIINESVRLPSRQSYCSVTSPSEEAEVNSWTADVFFNFELVGT